VAESNGLRLTVPTLTVMRFIGKQDRDPYGLAICEGTGLASGTVYPILKRLSKAGWLGSRGEGIDPHDEGRPVRTYYWLTSEGRKALERNTTVATASAAVFAATEAIRSGDWDQYLDQLNLAIYNRMRVRNGG